MKIKFRPTKRFMRRTITGIIGLAALGGAGYVGYLVGHEDRIAEALDREVYGPRKVVEFVEMADGSVVLGRNDLAELLQSQNFWEPVVADLPLTCDDALDAAREIITTHDGSLRSNNEPERIILQVHLQLARDMCIYWDYREFMVNELDPWLYSTTDDDTASSPEASETGSTTDAGGSSETLDVDGAGK